MEVAQKTAAEKSEFSEYDYSNFYYGAGEDPINLLRPTPTGTATRAQRLLPLPGGPGLRSHHPRARPQRPRRPVDGSPQPASYNYLGISYRPEVKKAAAEAVEKYGLGASGSPILSGTFDIHEEFAAELARFKDKESASSSRRATAPTSASSPP